MPHARNAVFALLFLALAAAAWLWWSSAAGNLPSVRPEEVDATDAKPAAGSVVDAADIGGEADGDRPPVERTEVAVTERARSGRWELRVTAMWPDGVPAADVMVYLRRSVPRLPYTAFARGITGDDGVIVFADVPRGPSTLASDRGDRQKITVEGGQQEVTFELEGGIAVRGTVQDPDGVRVAGAGVWLQSRDTTWSGGRVAAFTDAAGEFALERVNPEQSLGAVARNFAPSKLVDLDVIDTSRPPAIVELTLLPDGGQLQGTVTDADGEPIAAAIVAVGKGPNHLDYDGERLIEHWTVRTAETDDQGSFGIDGLATGNHAVAIRAHGYGLWRSEVAIERHGVTVIAPHLELAATLSGTVTDGDGAPLRKASVRAYDRAPRTSFLAGGQIDFDQTFSYRAAIADGEGNYHIEGITPGSVFLFAQRHRERRQRDGVSVAYVQTEIDVEPGSDASWDPVITDGMAIEGVVLYADGFPISGLFITLADEKSGGKEHVIVSSREGVFRFLCLDDSTYQIRVQLWDAPKGMKPLQASGVIPDRGRRELRVSYDKPVKKEPGSVVGRINDDGGRIRNPNATTITLHSDARWFRPGGKIENGAFRFDKVTPCRFRLTLKEDENVLAQTDWFELLPAATVDIGVLTTEPAGAASISILRSQGSASFEPKFYLKRKGTSSSTMIELGRRTEALADNLTPGDYELSGYFKGMVSVREKFQVVAGQTTDVELELQAGAPLRCEVWWPEGEVKSATRKYRILDGTGLLKHEYEGGLFTSPTRPYKLRYTLPPGRWKIEFSTDDGLAGEVEFTVENTTDEVKPRIDLK